MAKGLGKHSFLKSVEEHENRGVNFVHFGAKSEKNEKSERTEIGRARWVEEEICGFGEDNMKECSTELARE
jgi:hypothetical protein